MDKLLDKLKELGSRILEWWNRFTAKQKTLIVAGVAVVIIAIVFIVSMLTQPQYVLLRECESTAEAAEVRDLLQGEDMTFEVSDDGLVIKILRDQLSDANLLLGANNIKAASYGIDNVTDGSFSTTESDKQKKYVVYLEKSLEHDFLMKFTAVKSANVTLHIPENDGTLIASEEESFATVVLELKDEFSADSAAYLDRKSVV